MKLSIALLFLLSASSDAADPCRLWLAPSHLSETEAPRYGLFAGVPFKENETLPNPEIALPLVDFLDGPYQATYPDILRKLETYLWTSEYAGAKWEGNHSSTVLVPGVGVLAHYHSAYSNIDWLQGSVLMRSVPEFWESGKPHASRGAISPYYNMTMRATTDIPAGMELFANFGDVWDDFKEDLYEQTLSRWDYLDADKILKRMDGYLSKYEKELKTETAMEVVDFMRESILGPHHGRRAKPIRSLLPQTPKKVKEALETGGTFLYRNQDMIKSQEWLEKKGICVDTMEIKKSTIEDAGFGAFATRDFKEGERITVSPMITIPEELLNMYKIKEVLNEGGEKIGLEYDFDAPIGQQLIVNYAFGHSESSVLFLPTSPFVAYINHDSTHSNAYLDWSDHEFVQSKDELTTSDLDEMKAEPQQSVVLMIVATRDISKGEEILLDYGVNWEAAWDEYKSKQQTSGEWPMKAADVAQNYINQPYPVDLKVGKIPYPKGVVTACYIQAEEVPDGRPKENEKHQAYMKWTGPKTFEEYVGLDLVVCDLIKRDVDKTHGYVYTIKARTRGNNDIVEVEGVPHVAITLTDRPYTSEIHMEGAFRRNIDMDDSRFPQQWRDLRE